MAKNKHSGGHFGRSDIPYKDRLLMDKYSRIRDHRNDAARVVLKVACVALNDTEGLGYQRLSRFAKRLRELVQEYYADPDVQEVHLNERLEQMGFIIDPNGVMFCVENSQTGEVMPKKLIEVRDDG